MKKSRIIFLPVPESFYKQLSGEADDIFQINPDIPIPVEIPPDVSEDASEDAYEENFVLENLSTEMILAGMLRVIEEGEVKREWIDYYCRFVLFMRSDILTEIKKTKESGLSDAHYQKANKLIRDGKPEEALSAIRDFLERYPLVWNGWFLLGWALRLLGRWTDGEAAFRKTIELGGGNSDTRNELAICLMEKGDTSGAKRELEAALAEDPENVKIISNLGVLALKTGEREKAEGFFRTVLEIDEDDPVAKEFLSKDLTQGTRGNAEDAGE